MCNFSEDLAFVTAMNKQIKTMKKSACVKDLANTEAKHVSPDFLIVFILILPDTDTSNSCRETPGTNIQNGQVQMEHPWTL